MSDPKIYTIVQAPLLGQLGERTKMVEGATCPKCNTRPRSKIVHLDHVFDYWEGQPLLNVARSLIVTEALRAKLQASSLEGFSFHEMDYEYSADYEKQPGDPDLAVFWQLVVDNRCAAGSGWWTRDGVCKACGRALWKMNEFTTRGIARAHSDRAVPKRTVVRSSYHGWDIFHADDPGPALITQAMRDFLLANGVVGLELQAAKFVDSAD